MILTIIIGLLLNIIVVSLFYHYTMEWKIKTVFDLLIALLFIIFSFIPFFTALCGILGHLGFLFIKLMDKEL